MAKTERLFRVESVFGGGLYTGDARLGIRLSWREIRDIDLYSGGVRKVQEYRALDGTRREHRPFHPRLDYAMFCDLPEQLGFDFPREPGSRSNHKTWVGNETMQYGFTNESNNSPYPVNGQPPEQLALDVTREPVVIERHIQRNGRFTLSELIEHNLFSDLDDDYGLADETNNRPMPGNDGINAKITSAHRFAFRSLERMSAWLDRATPKQILECGAVIRVIDVRAAIHGKCQSIYHKRDVVKEFAIVPGELWRVRNQIPKVVNENA